MGRGGQPRAERSFDRARGAPWQSHRVSTSLFATLEAGALLAPVDPRLSAFQRPPSRFNKALGFGNFNTYEAGGSGGPSGSSSWPWPAPWLSTPWENIRSLVGFPSRGRPPWLPRGGVHCPQFRRARRLPPALPVLLIGLLAVMATGVTEPFGLAVANGAHLGGLLTGGLWGLVRALWPGKAGIRGASE